MSIIQLVKDFRRVRRDANTPISCVSRIGRHWQFDMSQKTSEYMGARSRLPSWLRCVAVKTAKKHRDVEVV